jgi:3-phosphoshikimate 1-carboxyvinyltransferase
MNYCISREPGILDGEITLNGSKSISNRILIIRALCNKDFEVHGLSTSADTQILQKILGSKESTWDAGHAGTCFRFLTAFATLQSSTIFLTGSDRMKQRPIGPLVDALNSLGSRIAYAGRTGYPPLQIEPSNYSKENNKVVLPGDISSQFITALLLIAPLLPGGLIIQISGELVSKPYGQMTLHLMRQFGVSALFHDNRISVNPSAYFARPFSVEADWSAASYFYTLAGLNEDSVDLQLNGLHQDSIQGDGILATIMKKFHVDTHYNSKGIRLIKQKGILNPTFFKWDFLECPDIAQSLAVLCAGTGTKGVLSGLKTLKIKETNRLEALKNELNKVKCPFTPAPGIASSDADHLYHLIGKATFDHKPIFQTYEDHRMAMSMACFSLIHPVCIHEPTVVKKSYPEFWNDLAKLDFRITSV